MEKITMDMFQDKLDLMKFLKGAILEINKSSYNFFNSFDKAFMILEEKYPELDFTRSDIEDMIIELKERPA